MLRHAVSKRTSVSWLFLFIWELSLLLSPTTVGAEAGAKVLAKVGDRTISYEELQTIMGGSEEGDPAGKDSKIEVLKELVRIEVFSREAHAVGLDQDEKLQKEIKGIINFYLAKEYVKRNVQDAVTVSKEEVEEYYQKHPEEFQNREKMKVRQIFLYVEPDASDQESQETKDLAEDLLQKAMGGEGFSKLSTEFSSDEVLAQEGGDLGYIGRGFMAPEYSDAVFALKVGEISPVLKGRSGYSIFKIEDVKPPSIKPFYEVQEMIEQRLREERADKKFLELERSLFGKYQVEIWEEKLQDDLPSED